MYLETESGQPLLTQSGENLLIQGPSIPTSLPLQNILPSYLYQQYSDDPDLQAFVASFNAIAQSYLDWFNDTPLAVYTSPNVNGPLLDWIGQGIYGISRPVFSSETTSFVAGLNAPLFALNAPVIPLNGSQFSQSGTATVATDDFYKRTITWCTYIGNGRYFNLQVLRMKIARFLFGVNGTDVTVSQSQVVSIVLSAAESIAITIPPSTAATFFKQALAQGTLPLPFQLTATVTIT
jgi:hypothetical protein